MSGTYRAMSADRTQVRRGPAAQQSEMLGHLACRLVDDTVRLVEPRWPDGQRNEINTLVLPAAIGHRITLAEIIAAVLGPRRQCDALEISSLKYRHQGCEDIVTRLCSNLLVRGSN